MDTPEYLTLPGSYSPTSLLSCFSAVTDGRAQRSEWKYCAPIWSRIELAADLSELGNLLGWRATDGST